METTTPDCFTMPGLVEKEATPPTILLTFHRVLQNRNNNSDQEKDVYEYMAFMVWYFLLVLCCIIPTLCAYRRRRLREIRLLRERHQSPRANASAHTQTLLATLQNRLESVRSEGVHKALEATTMIVTSDSLIKREGRRSKSRKLVSDIETGDSSLDEVSDVADLDEREFAWLQLPTDAPNASRRVAAACAVCLGPYEVGNSVTWSTRSECRHAYHRECIEKWLCRKDERLCPCCRQEFCSELNSSTARNMVLEEGAVPIATVDPEVIVATVDPDVTIANVIPEQAVRPSRV